MQQLFNSAGKFVALLDFDVHVPEGMRSGDVFRIAIWSRVSPRYSVNEIAEGQYAQMVIILEQFCGPPRTRRHGKYVRLLLPDDVSEEFFKKDGVLDMRNAWPKS